MLLKIVSVFFVLIGLLGLIVGLFRVRKLIKSITIERRLWRALSAFICFFILGYLIYLPYGFESESAMMFLIVGSVFCFGGVFVALVTSLSVKTIDIVHNLENLRIQNKSLRFKAVHDDLTGLYKRGFFSQAVQYACEVAKYSKNVSSVLFIDFDKFKKINDTYGHQAGDRVLKAVAGLFISHFRKDDVVARLGGDEFGILLNNTAYNAALRMSVQLIKKVSELQIPINNNHIIIPSISIGVAEISEQCYDSQMVVSNADQACYAHKTSKKLISEAMYK